MKNLTVIIAAVIALIVMTLAIMLRPVQRTGEWETETSAVTETKTETTEKSSETAKIEQQSTETTAETIVYTKTTTIAQTAEISTERKAESKFKFGSKFAEIESKLQKKTEAISKTEKIEMTPQEFRRAGVVYSGGYRYTWYSERVLPGKGLNIPGRHSDGNYVRDGDGYIVLASCDLPKGTVVQTPFGAGKVYDVCAVSGTIDVYTSW